MGYGYAVMKTLTGKCRTKEDADALYKEAKPYLKKGEKVYVNLKDIWHIEDEFLFPLYNTILKKHGPTALDLIIYEGENSFIRTKIKRFLKNALRTQP